MWPQIDILVVNEGEAAELAGMPVADPASAEAAGIALRARGPARVLVTLGAQGVVVVDAAGARHAPARPVRAIDTTAAGDTFIGALAAALCEGKALDDAVALGQGRGRAVRDAARRAGLHPAPPRDPPAHAMKRTALLHAELSEVIARLGHGDLLVIGDAGLPIPDGPRRIDLAVAPGVPRFHEVLAAVLSEMQVESAIVADELAARNPDVHATIRQRLAAVPIAALPHEDFKALTRGARAIVRSGEFSPYANVILRAGVVF